MRASGYLAMVFGNGLGGCLFERCGLDDGFQKAGIEEHVEPHHHPVGLPTYLGSADFLTRSENDQEEVLRNVEIGTDIEKGAAAGDVLDQAAPFLLDLEMGLHRNDHAGALYLMHHEAALRILDCQDLVEIFEFSDLHGRHPFPLQPQ